MASVYGYKPSIPLAVIGTSLFIGATLSHLSLYIKKKTWYFHMMIIAATMEAAGFETRAYSTIHPDQTRMFLISYQLLTLAPSIMAAALFSTFVRTMWYVTPSERRKFTTTWVPGPWIMKLFTLAYVSSCLVQFIGAGAVVGAYASPTSTDPSDPDTLRTGQHMLVAAFIVQVACTTLFLIVGLHFMIVGRKWQGTCIGVGIEIDEALETKKSWRRLMWTVNGAAALIVLRTIYRIVEFSASTPAIEEYLTRNEWTFWVCDAIPMAAILILFLPFHPSASLPKAFTRFTLPKKAIRKQEQKIREVQTWTPPPPPPSSSSLSTSQPNDHGQPTHHV